MAVVDRLNPIIELLRHSPGRVNKVFIQKEGGPGRLAEVVREARAHSVPFVFVPRNVLDRMSRHHQGALAETAAKEYASVEDILSGSKNPFVVLLDGIEDPQNLGAIIRSAEGAGADGIILPERRSAGLTETVDTVSAGALARLKVARVTNLVPVIEDLKGRGLRVVGAEASGDVPWHELDFTGPVALVLGSEGRGLRPLVRRSCDSVVFIPLAGAVNSLNVAAAAAVLFFEVVRQRK
jgi:23S rRNA (guanosine2251-2'-O)-methyltransferase